MIKQSQVMGLGCCNYQLGVVIGNRPEIEEYQDLTNIQPVSNGEIANIGLQCGNGWRKVFNVYAKLLFCLAEADRTANLDISLNLSLVRDFKNWQDYRESLLLQKSSQTALIFGEVTISPKANQIHILSGKTHAKNLIAKQLVDPQFDWLDSEFAVNRAARSIICPYFDYRQLSNIKIERLVKLISSL